MRLGEIAEKLGCKLEGPEELEITAVAGLEEAGPSDLTFLSNPKYRRKLRTTRAAAIILSPEEPDPGRPALRSANPYLDFARALEYFYPPVRPEPAIHPTAIIAPSSKIGRSPSIGPYVVIERGVEIGDDCVIKGHVVIYEGAKIGHRFLAHSHVVVRENVQIGNDVVLQNGAVIGSDGFGFARQTDGSYYKIVQAGSVVIEDNVEVQANSCIDRATVGVTHLRKGAKVDNLVQVGHACDIGENTLLCGQSGLAGSCEIGKNVVLAGQVGVAGHLTIGDNVIATAQTGIPSDIESNNIISGYPAMDNSRWLKCSAAFARLPEIYAAVRGQINRPLASEKNE
ncbi:MAG: UDP-3-O-(3-hydroxymyristoyl)glucosamine N-acyltransferase [Acidobacteria bacterium]|nr:MAG: UDP-3-O-(3-hydroxymyristoyl)glucosamine N-acyltransferase [Acidobacteriota bacterium]